MRNPDITEPQTSMATLRVCNAKVDTSVPATPFTLDTRKRILQETNHIPSVAKFASSSSDLASNSTHFFIGYSSLKDSHTVMA